MNSSAETLAYEPMVQPQREAGLVRILVVDDEEAVRISVRELLLRHSYSVDVAASGEEALERLCDYPFDLVLLDLVLPDLSGMEVAQRVREIQPDAKVILLTGHGTLESAVEAIHIGIFDYLLKTESAPYILSRIAEAVAQRREERHEHQLLDELRVVIQRIADDTESVPQTETTPQTISVGPFHITPWQQTVRISEQIIRLTSTEMHVLACLAQRAGQVVTYHEIAHCGLGSDAEGIQAAKLIKPHVYHLRQKLEADPSNPRHILTVRSVGYLLAVDADAQDADGRIG